MVIDPLPAADTITLGSRTLRYRDIGTGPPLVFVHGLLVNSALWRHVIPSLAMHFRCIVPDLPLGAHSIPMPEEADQTPLGVAHLVADLIAELGLTDVTLVGNDTGGAICQIVIAHRPANITRLVLTNCDAFEAFFPAQFNILSHAARFFGESFVHALVRVLRARPAQRLLLATVSRRRYADEELDAYLAPLLRQPAIQRDAHRFLAAVSNRYTLDAARAFAGFRHPVLIVWGRSDLLFSPRLARRLQAAFPDATLEWAPRSRAFVPEDQPALLAAKIAAFIGVSEPLPAMVGP